MARNLRKGSKVILPTGAKGIVMEKFTVRKGSVDLGKRPGKEARTLVRVNAFGTIFVKRPSELKRRKK